MNHANVPKREHAQNHIQKFFFRNFLQLVFKWIHFMYILMIWGYFLRLEYIAAFKRLTNIKILTNIISYFCWALKLKAFPAETITFPALVLSYFPFSFKKRPMAFSSWAKPKKKDLIELKNHFRNASTLKVRNL